MIWAFSAAPALLIHLVVAAQTGSRSRPFSQSTDSRSRLSHPCSSGVFRRATASWPLLILALAACGQDSHWHLALSAIRGEFRDVTHLSTEELSAWLDDPSRTQPLLLDARSEVEYQVSHLKAARLLTRELEERLQGLSRSQPVVIYCSLGWRSSQAVRRLQQLGFDNAYNLEGSIFLWANEGRPLYRQDRQVFVVHPYDKVWERFLKPEFRSLEKPLPGATHAAP